MIVIHVPHSSKTIPDDVSDLFVLNDAEFEGELLRMTDWYVDELFALPATKATAVTYRVSRLVCDPERFEDDAEEPMAERGMGVIYTSTNDGRKLRSKPKPAERKSLLARYYRPHHDRLTAAVAEVLAAEGKCLIVDAHSFPSRPLPHELDQRLDRPAICIGTDKYHTPPWLRRPAFDASSARFDTVAFDRPFAGTLVPMAYYRRDRRVHSIMIEVNRGLYMDEATGEKLPCFDEVASRLRDAVDGLDDSV